MPANSTPLAQPPERAQTSPVVSPEPQRSSIEQELAEIRWQLSQLTSAFYALIAQLEIVGVVPKFGTPEPKSPENKESGIMANFLIKLAKRAQMPPVSSKPASKIGLHVITTESIDDASKVTMTVMGQDAGGSPVDISSVATIAVTDDNPAVATADPPIGVTDLITGITPGTANLTVTVTWNDPTAGIGPFVFTQPVLVAAGPVTGVVPTFGTPVPK